MGAIGAYRRKLEVVWAPHPEKLSTAVQGADVAMTVQLQEVAGMPRAAMAAVVLARLRSVPWSRVDCAWRDAQVPMFAHNNIQVTRGWLNWDVCSSAPIASRPIDCCPHHWKPRASLLFCCTSVWVDSVRFLEPEVL